jgi:uncharacterized protein
MIHYIKIKNFYSINLQQEVSFVVDGAIPKNNSYLVSDNVTLSKLNMFIGSNASGKTNLLKAFSFIKWLIGNSFAIAPTASLPYKRFFDSTEKSSLEIRFEIENKYYTYSVEFIPERVLSETLNINQLIKTRRTDSNLFTRIFDPKTQKYIFDGDDFDRKDLSKSQSVMDRSNTTVLAIGNQLSHPLSMLISEYWNKINTNIFENGYGGENPISLHVNLLNLHLNNDEKLKVEKVLRKFDLGFDSVFLETEQVGNEITVKGANEVHNFNGKEYTNSIDYASQGTKRLIIIIRYVLAAIQNQSPVILDEIEAFLHPEILREIIDMFIDPEVKAQLIFTSHSHFILNMLDKEQIFLSEKNQVSGNTEVYKLSDVEGVRNDQNFYNKYIAGAYGAIPRL